MKLFPQTETDVPFSVLRAGSADSGLAERVRRFLHDRVSDVKELTIEASGCTVVLRGQVSSPSTRRLCLECCRRVAGVIHIIDDIVVLQSNWRPPAK